MVETVDTETGHIATDIIATDIEPVKKGRRILFMLDLIALLRASETSA
jgi:hypothetical protein